MIYPVVRAGGSRAQRRQREAIAESLRMRLAECLAAGWEKTRA